MSSAAMDAVFRLIPLPCLVVDETEFRLSAWNDAASILFSTLYPGAPLCELFPFVDFKCGTAAANSLTEFLAAWPEKETKALLPCKAIRLQLQFDITINRINRNTAEHQLLLSFEERTAGTEAVQHSWSTVYEMARMGYWSRQLADDHVEWSDEMYELFGQERGVFIPHPENVAACFHHGDRHLMESSPAHLFGPAGYRDFEYRIITPAGHTRWLSERTMLIRDATGRPVQLQGIVRDNTELKTKAIALKQSNERYELVLRATHEAICDWDIETGKATWDDSFQELFGHDVRQYNNDVWSANIHADDREWVLLRLQEVLSENGPGLFFEEYRFYRADRSVALVQHTGAIHRNSHGVAIRAIGSLKDVTEYKETLFRIQQQHQKLKDISWIQSHVVRAPLARLMGLADLAKSPSPETISMEEIISHISHSAEELDRIIRDIISKSEQLEQE